MTMTTPTTTATTTETTTTETTATTAFNTLAKRLFRLEQSARIGWWETDDKKEKITVSEYLVHLFDLDSQTVDLSIFRMHIVPEYRRDILLELILSRESYHFNQIFQMHSRHGEIWVKAEIVGEENTGEGKSILFGYVQQIDDPKEDHASLNRVNNLLRQQNTISRSLLSLLHTHDMEEIIREILFDLVCHFKAGKAYLIKADLENGVFQCVSEMKKSPHLASVKEMYPIRFDQSGMWWVDKLSHGQPILLFGIGELPEEACFMKTLFENQGVRSAMLVPILINGFWGYAGVDVLEENRNWGSEDYKWFSSLIHIIGLCMELHQSGRKAQIEKEHLENLYQHLPMGYFLIKMVTDENCISDFCIVDANNEARLNFLSDSSEGDSKLGSEVFGEDFPALLGSITRLLKETEHSEFVFYQASSGKYYRTIFYLTQNKEGVLLMSDITQNYLAQSALEKSEEILRNLYDKFPVGIELYDKDGILVDMNDKDVTIFGGGLKKEDILGINIFDHPILLPEIKEKMRRRETVDFTSSFDCSVLAGYYDSQRSDTFELTTKISYLYDKHGELINYMFINIDNLDTVNAYKKIQEFEAYFSMIADYAKVGYYKWNPIKKEGFAIGQWFKNLGRPMAHTLHDIEEQYSNMHPDDLLEVKRFYIHAMTGKQKSFSKEIRILKEDGTIHWLRSYKMVKVYKPENDCIEIVGMNFDITQLKEVEQKLIVAKEKAETADQFKTTFLANMSHEIRTPLNAIIGFSDILAEVDEESEREEYRDLVRKNSDLLLKLVDDILDLSRIKVGKYEFVPENVELCALCSDAIDSINARPREAVEVYRSKKMRKFTLRTDRERLLQVINNLLGNAMKFTEKGTIELGYEIQDRQVKFYVKDTGIGIPPDRCEKVFERFEKVNSFVQGTGLGLSICRQIVDKMGGEIGVESKLGEGSLFWFTVPYFIGDTTGLLCLH